MKFALCPKFIEHASKHKATLGIEVLYQIANRRTPYKVYLDNQGYLLKEYNRIAGQDDSGFIFEWLVFLAKNDAIKSIDSNSEDDCIHEITVNLLKQTIFDRNLVITDEAAYRAFSDDIISYDIRLHDPEQIAMTLNGNYNRQGIFNQTAFLKHLISILLQMLERKHTHTLEDLYNDHIVDSLRQHDYIIADQTRSGSSASGITAGELDIVVRSQNGLIETIIEAFRLESCGPLNTIVSKHIDKLINKYDTAGHERNYVVVYSESADFNKNWIRYFEYVSDLNSKPDFSSTCPLKLFEDTEKDLVTKADFRIGRAIHIRNGREIEIMHLFVNFHNNCL